ncbi:MAG: hypothetical protein A3D10_04480 [Omnitrophica WOR_2 bacterium RIFCSPHIGHO2_02_FULL_48_11]|nr:MAG: hypothetical protein A3D10_04480 [Omnitrophica WOR_2 bacterium RIFCSPHIGHO2_02_FULL_48_11]
MSLIEKIGLVSSVILPLWNIPLIVRIIKRGSSNDISRSWALGVWVCLLLMAPSGFTSADIVWRTFNAVNLVLFTVVVIIVLKYHKGKTA